MSLSDVVIEYATVSGKIVAAGESHARGRHLLQVDGAQLPAIEPQVQLIAASCGAKVVAVAQLLLHPYLVDVAARVLRVVVDETQCIGFHIGELKAVIHGIAVDSSIFRTD